MSELIVQPEISVKGNNEIIFVKTLPGDEDTELAEVLKKHIKAESKLNGALAAKALNSWYRSGLGPHPTSGGTWVTNSVLTPSGSPSGVIDSIKYNYDRDGYGGWASQISVRLYIYNSAGFELGYADITASGSDTIVASGSNIPANCKLVLAMKVGNLNGGIFNPPYIDGYDCTVYYN
ncbi:hypothetical protein [Pectobacterium aroidearum]|uniref:hypothetical protein n=1 Tax=Pectobacterium aroidearum TaxID=1201031 RepID=UPI003015AF76